MHIDKIMRSWSRLLVTSSLLGVLALVSSPVSALQVDRGRQGSDVEGGYDHESAPVARAVQTGESLTVDGLLEEEIGCKHPRFQGFSRPYRSRANP